MKKPVVFVLNNGCRMLWYGEFTRDTEVQKTLGMDYWIDDPSPELIEEVQRESKSRTPKLNLWDKFMRIIE